MSNNAADTYGEPWRVHRRSPPPFRGSTLVDIAPRDTSPTGYPLYLRDHLRASPSAPLRASQAPMKGVTRFVPNRIITNW